MSRFASGKKSKAISDISGFQVRYTQLKTTWDNLRVEPDEYDAKHPQLTPAKNVVDATALQNPRPDNDPENVEILIGFTKSIALSRLARSQQSVGINTFGRVGFVGISLNEPVTGVAGTGAIGTFNTGAVVSGVNATGNIGDAEEQDEIAITETGLAGTGAIGLINTGAVVGSTNGTGNIGTVSLNFDFVFDQNGVGGTGTTGDESFDTQTGALTGQAGTGATGNETVGSEPSPSGVSGTGAIGVFGETDGNQLSLSIIPTSAVGTASTGLEVAENEILEQSVTGWNQQYWNYGIWGGDGNIEGITAIGSHTIDIFIGPNPVNSVSGTGATGAEVPSIDTSAMTGQAGTGAVGNVSLDTVVEILSGVSGLGRVGNEEASVNAGWNEGAWNEQTWSN